MPHRGRRCAALRLQPGGAGCDLRARAFWRRAQWAEDQAPWKEDVNFFKAVRMSAVPRCPAVPWACEVALIKIVMHTKSGAPLEVMGLMQGKVTPERAWAAAKGELPQKYMAFCGQEHYLECPSWENRDV